MYPHHLTAAQEVTWVITTQTAPWLMRKELAVETGFSVPNVIVRTESPRQLIEGFGASFNELGWMSLAVLDAEERDGVLRELFAPGVGANFTLCRMPVGANDVSRGWYSYDEVPGDFALEHFSIANDLQTLVPFIRSALAHQPDLRLWASPWSPPTWMKTNKHYAAAMPVPGFQSVSNGLQPDQVGKEGTDMFLQEERYFRAYASYFGRFVDEYRKQGITIGMVMPQNEFNSPQVFEVSLSDPEAGKYIKGAGVQWAGKRAIAVIHRLHPDLRLYQTEQECGDGRNDWRYCRYAWSQMKHYLGNGASAYLYWNLSMQQGGLSSWGWAQNSLVTVDTTAKTFVYNHEYYLMKHVSHFVRPGARVLETSSYNGYENQLAFANPDGSLVVVMQNDLSEELPVRLMIGGRIIAPTLPADSFNTFVVPPAEPAPGQG